jgi:hypothetical protein
MLIGLLLTACVEANQQSEIPDPVFADSNLDRVSIVIKMPTSEHRQRFIGASATRFNNNGSNPGYAATVTLNVRLINSYTRHNVFLSPLDRNTAEAFANTNGQNVSSDLALGMGQDIARQSVCQGRTVTQNTIGRSYTVPANAPVRLGGPVPEGSIGQPLSAVEYSRQGLTVNLWCR